jgi:hypothetical protein
MQGDFQSSPVDPGQPVANAAAGAQQDRPGAPVGLAIDRSPRTGNRCARHGCYGKGAGEGAQSRLHRGPVGPCERRDRVPVLAIL